MNKMIEKHSSVFIENSIEISISFKFKKISSNSYNVPSLVYFSFIPFQH